VIGAALQIRVAQVIASMPCSLPGRKAVVNCLHPDFRQFRTGKRSEHGKAVVESLYFRGTPLHNAEAGQMNIEITAKLSSKNQVTIPADVRRQLGVGASDQITFVLSEDGRVEVKRPRYTLESVLGSVPALPGASADFEREIEEATAAEMARKFPRERRG
jgi:AbrB family looped-hinge helix DNA binding protein